MESMTGFLCGLRRNAKEYDLYCWGALEPSDHFFGDGAICTNTIAELDAAPRKALPVARPLTIEAGNYHLCALGSPAAMTCAGFNNNFNVCGSDDNCTSTENIVCPEKCVQAACDEQADALSLRGDRTCVLDDLTPGAVKCIGPGSFNATAASLCGFDVAPTMIGAAEKYVCIVDGSVEPHKTCCGMLDGAFNAPVPDLEDAAIAKIAAWPERKSYLASDFLNLCAKNW